MYHIFYSLNLSYCSSKEGRCLYLNLTPPPFWIMVNIAEASFCAIPFSAIDCTKWMRGSELLSWDSMYALWSATIVDCKKPKESSSSSAKVPKIGTVSVKDGRESIERIILPRMSRVRTITRSNYRCIRSTQNLSCNQHTGGWISFCGSGNSMGHWGCSCCREKLEWDRMIP